jgi:hypothetical protein
MNVKRAILMALFYCLIIHLIALNGSLSRTSASGRYLLYATTKAEGPVLRGKRLFTGCGF